MNRNYGRLTEGVLKYAPDTIHEGDTWNVCPNEAAYLAAGYLPVDGAMPTEPAPEGQHWDSLGWQELDGKIRMMWELVDDPPAPPRRWTPLSIKRTVAAAGHWDALKAAMESADKFDEFLMAQVIVEDDASYAAMRSAAIAIAGSEEAADALIDKIPQEV